jgi:hypothetical protein
MKNNTITYILFILVSSLASIQSSKAQDISAEQIHIHLQKSTYIAGEAIHFKLYCLNSKTQKLSKLSKVAYIELISENGFPVAQTDIILENGMGEGGITISEQIPTGNYAINAYTHWMKTSSSNFISVRSLFIFNNQNIDEKIKTSEKLISSTFRDLKNNDLNLFDSKNELQSISIKTKIEDANRILRISLGNNNSIVDETYKLKLQSKEGEILDKHFKFDQQQWELLLKVKDLKSTNYNLSIYNSESKLVKTAVIHLAQSHKGRLIEKPRIIKKMREKVKIKLQLKDLSYQNDSLFLSASIKLKEPNNTSINIIDYMNLYSDFGANMVSYSEKLKQFSKQSWIAEGDIETLWLNNTNSYSIDTIRYPENETYILEGQIKNIKTDQAFANENIFLSKIGAYADISTFSTNSNGQFYFNLPLRKGLHDISIQVKGHNELNLAVELKDKFRTEGFAPTPWSPESLKGEQLTFIKKQFENFRIRNIYKQETFKETKDTCLYRGQSSFYGKPENLIKVDDYILLDSLEEYFHEFISTIKIKYRKKKPYMHIFSPDASRTFKQQPLIMFDGLILSDASQILNKRPIDIEKIEVVPFEYYYGSSHLYGIISVTSKKRDCELDELPKNTSRYYLPLFTKNVEFSEQETDIQKNHPDYRTDLLWEPNITLSHDKSFELEFTTSDVKGEYELTVQGLSENGDPIVIKQSILIK